MHNRSPNQCVGGKGSRCGPSISAIPFQHKGTGLTVPLLSATERGRLASIATVSHFERGRVIFQENDDLTCIYNIAHGVVRTCHVSSEGRRAVTTFLFAEDLVGLAENGRYTATAEAATPVTAFRLPIAALGDLLQRDPELELHFLCKVCHELRQAQRHGILLSRRDAAGRVALFLQMLSSQSLDRGRGKIAIPMSRADVADYTGLSIEAVSRALRRLERSRILSFNGPQEVEIVDRIRFNKLLVAT